MASTSLPVAPGVPPEADLNSKNAQFTTPLEIARLIVDATNVASF
jgi:hypothetical protein